MSIATLIAAIIAAAASVYVALLNVASQRSAEWRAIHRKSLEPFVVQLGESIHSIVAITNVYLKKFKNTPEGRAARKIWLTKVDAPKEKLKSLRPKLRYILWGLDEGLRTLSRLPDWVPHADYDKKRAEKNSSARKDFE